MKTLLPIALLLFGGIGSLSADQVQSKPPTANDWFQTGSDCLNHQDWNGAINAFDQALAENSNLDMAYVGRGEAKMHLEESEQALHDFDHALQLNARNPLAHFDRATIRNENGNISGTLVDLNETLQISEQWAPALFFRGMTYLRINRWADAQADFRSLAALNPDDPRAHVGFGLEKRVEHDPVAAMKEFNLACQSTPPLMSAVLNRADLHEELGEYSAAESDFNLALNLAPQAETGPIYIDRALVEWQDKHPELAANDFHTACNLAGGRKEGDYPHFFLWLIGKENRDPGADAALATFVSIHSYQRPGDWEGKIGQYLLGQLPEKDFFLAALTPGDEDADEQTCEAWYYSGMKLLLSGDRSAAVDHLQKCVAQQKIFFLEYLLAEGKLKELAPGRK